MKNIFQKNEKHFTNEKKELENNFRIKWHERQSD